MLIPRKQNDFAAPYSERTSAKIDVDGQDRPPPEIYLEKRPAVFRTLETGRQQSRFRVRRKDATRCEASSAKIRRQSVGIRCSSRKGFRAQPTPSRQPTALSRFWIRPFAERDAPWLRLR